MIAETQQSEIASAVGKTGPDELSFQLGLWLSGLESFLNIRNHWFAEENRGRMSARDWSKEFRLTHSTLMLCSKLAFDLGRAVRESRTENDEGFDLAEELGLESERSEFSSDDLFRLSSLLKDAILLNDGLLRAAPLRFGEWSAWSRTLSEKLRSLDVVARMQAMAERSGESNLPDALNAAFANTKLAQSSLADLQLVLPRFGRILKWLSVIERMLKTDEPLKPSLLLFARIYEQIQELTGYINNRLARFPDEDDELFGQLDGAAYTASIELRKVYNYELAGLSDLRSTPLIYAKIETAFSLLNDSFQLTLINFAQMADPAAEPHLIFPNLKSKLDQSLDLRKNLWALLGAVKAAEQDPEKYPMNTLHEMMQGFLRRTVNYLFYKDRETIERFIEEVLATRGKQDLVPILHRFGAYVETLFGQVNMRVVLAAHPFDYESGK